MSVGSLPATTFFVASAIQAVEDRPAPGPQKRNSGKRPRSRWSSSRRPAGLVQTSGTFRPFARYCGRGVTATSAVVAMLNHQNRFAVVTRGSSAFRASQTDGPRTRRLLCFQEWISARRRSNQPLPTTPWPSGPPTGRPVSIVDCTLQVTAGKTGSSSRWPCSSAHARSRGANLISLGVRPTTSRRATGWGAAGTGAS